MSLAKEHWKKKSTEDFVALLHRKHLEAKENPTNWAHTEMLDCLSYRVTCDLPCCSKNGTGKAIWSRRATPLQRDNGFLLFLGNQALLKELDFGRWSDMGFHFVEIRVRAAMVRLEKKLVPWESMIFGSFVKFPLTQILSMRLLRASGFGRDVKKLSISIPIMQPIKPWFCRQWSSSDFSRVWRVALAKFNCESRSSSGPSSS